MPDRPWINRMFCQSSESMFQVPDGSAHLVVTSQPYNVGVDYDVCQDDMPWEKYLGLMRHILAECHRVLVLGGRACMVMANTGRKPYLPLSHYMTRIAEEMGFLHRGEIIWDKGTIGKQSSAWGSWRSPSNPILRDEHEYILVFSKGRYARSDPGLRTISRNDFMEATKSVWHISPARSKHHPAPFPVEIPRRLIELYSFAGDVVLDPFAGIGTTAVAAIQTGRRFVLFDVNPAYLAHARRRISEAIEEGMIGNESC
jgi:modification methylase